MSTDPRVCGEGEVAVVVRPHVRARGCCRKENKQREEGAGGGRRGHVDDCVCVCVWRGERERERGRERERERERGREREMLRVGV
jgi:hypothetical protein